MIIDAHAHVGHGIYSALEPDDLLRMMDKYGIDQAVICPMDKAIILNNREGNDYIAAVVRQHPDRFMGFAVANPWYELQAVEELRRAVGEGLCGVKFNSALQAFAIDDEIVYPLVELAASYGIPIYFHTGTPIYAQPLQLLDLAELYPQADFILGHAAASDFWIDALPAVRSTQNIYVETSLRSGNAVIQSLIDEVGADRVMFGSDVPHSHYHVELAKMATLTLSPEARSMVMSGTIRKILGRAHLP